MCWDNGKENGNYDSILGYIWDILGQRKRRWKLLFSFCRSHCGPTWFEQWRILNLNYRNVIVGIVCM